jgi:hypothetical protein
LYRHQGFGALVEEVAAGASSSILTDLQIPDSGSQSIRVIDFELPMIDVNYKLGTFHFK